MGMKRITRIRRVLPTLAAALSLGAVTAHAQGLDTLATGAWSALPLPGSPREDRDRLAQIRTRAASREGAVASGVCGPSPKSLFREH